MKSENEQDASQNFELIVGEERTIITLFHAGVLEGYMRLEFEHMGAYSLRFCHIDHPFNPSSASYQSHL